MTEAAKFEIFLAVAPGLEAVLREELVEKGFRKPKCVPGGVTIVGGWREVWRANLEIRGASRVLARIASFRVVHLAQLDKLAREVDWAHVLRADRPVRVEASCKGSKIYHAGAVSERVGKAIAGALDVPIEEDARVCVRARIEDNVCTLSLDTSGELLHRRGFKAEVNKAPMRETLAALFLRAAGFDGKQALVDPMCGSGTFVIEAAEMAAALVPGRGRSFAFEDLVSFDAVAWQSVRQASMRRAGELPALRMAFGSDRDPGAVRMSGANAERAGVAGHTRFLQTDIREIEPPDTDPGLVIVNPPYGTRISNKKALYDLYGAFGDRMRSHFGAWRIALITTDTALARATRLPFEAPVGPVDHGGLKVRLYVTPPLPMAG